MGSRLVRIVAKNWIKGATSNSHGQFRAKAQAAGMSTGAYASKMADAPGKTGSQARLAKTLMKFKKGGSVSMLPGMDKPAALLIGKAGGGVMNLRDKTERK